MVEDAWWKRRGKTAKLSEKKKEARTVCVQRDKGWTHVIRVHDTTHLAVTTTVRATDAHEERINGLVKHRNYPPHSYIVNERYISRKKKRKKKSKPRKKKRKSEWHEPVTSPTPNPGRPQNR